MARGGEESGLGQAEAIIRPLPELVRNQIAAGEVIERPASVVKELFENALDAGAREVRVDLEEGGVRLVRVADDGRGMGPADLRLAFAPHATSKLRAVDDLDHIATLGFRGEALASIGSVARCRIYSRPAAELLGWAVENEGGRVSEPRETGGPAGTHVEVRDLFYNTPARRRFLKRTATELGRCLDVIQRLTLAHDELGVAATHDGRRVLDVEAGMGFRERIRRVFGAELADALEPVEARDGDTVLTGFVAPPRFARADTSRQLWLLNGRPVRDKVLIRVLREGFRGHLEHGRHPAAFLRLAMDPARVDVNVHPAKAEIRLRDERRTFGFLVNALREALRRSDMATPGQVLLDRAARRDPAPGATLPDPGPLRRPDPRERPGDDELRVYEVPGRPLELREREDAGPAGAAPAPPGTEPADPAGGWAASDDVRGPFVVVDRTYIVRALPDGLEIVDQHALHERVTFEELKAELERGPLEVQRRLVPELVEVTRAEARRLEEHLPALESAGLCFSVFGPTTIAVQGLPVRLRRPGPEELVRVVLDLIERTGRVPEGVALLEEVLHSAACRGSVMAGDTLSQDEIESLLRRAARIPEAQTCPHGRPTRVRFAKLDLEKAFHRK